MGDGGKMTRDGRKTMRDGAKVGDRLLANDV
jgi:hypothetical protein